MKPAVWKPVSIAFAVDVRCSGDPCRNCEKSMSWNVSVYAISYEGKHLAPCLYFN